MLLQGKNDYYISYNAYKRMTPKTKIIKQQMLIVSREKIRNIYLLIMVKNEETVNTDNFEEQNG